MKNILILIIVIKLDTNLQNKKFFIKYKSLCQKIIIFFFINYKQSYFIKLFFKFI